MKVALLVATGFSFAAVCWLTFAGTVSNVQVIGAYIAASLCAYALSKAEKSWAALVKWAWVALSLVLIFAIVTGPLDYLRLS